MDAPRERATCVDEGPERSGHSPSDAAVERRISARRSSGRDQLAKVVDWVVLVFLIVGGGWLGWHSLKLIRADIQMTEARSMVFAWAEGRAAWNVRDWVFARDSLLAASRTTPDNPAIQDHLGTLYTIRARDAWRSLEAQRSFYREAAREQRLSLALRPWHGWTWAALTESLNGIEPGSAEVWAAWRKAYAYAPHEPLVQSTLLAVGLLGWRSSPPDVKETMKTVYASAISDVRDRADTLAKQLQVRGWR